MPYNAATGVFTPTKKNSPAMNRAIDERRRQKALVGWVRYSAKDAGVSALNGMQVVWVVWTPSRKRPIGVGVSEKVSQRLVWLRSQAKAADTPVWSKVAISARGDVEQRARSLAMRWGLPLPRNRQAVEDMLETKRGKPLKTPSQSREPRSTGVVRKPTNDEAFEALVRELEKTEAEGSK